MTQATRGPARHRPGRSDTVNRVSGDQTTQAGSVRCQRAHSWAQSAAAGREHLGMRSTYGDIEIVADEALIGIWQFPDAGGDRVAGAPWPRGWSANAVFVTRPGPEGVRVVELASYPGGGIILRPNGEVVMIVEPERVPPGDWRWAVWTLDLHGPAGEKIQLDSGFAWQRASRSGPVQDEDPEPSGHMLALNASRSLDVRHTSAHTRTRGPARDV